MKKNIIFDLINKKYIESINTDSSYQFYSLDKLSNDIKIAMNNNLIKLNVATEPIKITEVINTCLDYSIISNNNASKREENMLSKYGKLWGSQTKYLYSKHEVLEDLKYFIKQKNF